MDEQVEIVLYLPLSNREITEPELQWLNGFQKIFKVAVEQFLSKEILFKQAFNFEDIDIHSKNSILIQIIQNENIDFSSSIQRISNDSFNVLNIIQVVCFPVKDEDISFKGKKSFNFYEENNGKVVYLNENQIHKIKDEIWLKLFDIALEVKNSLSRSKENVPGGAKHKNVFLAQTSADQNHNRNIIEREIHHLGYTVLSTDNKINTIQNYKSDVLNTIQNSLLSIHLIGNNYSPLVPDSDISVVEFQNNIFTELIEEKQNENIHRLVFIAPELKPKSEKQKQYIENFTHNIDALKNTEIIQAPIEIFKSIIQKKLNNLITEEKTETSKKVDKNDKKTIYLVYNVSDESVAHELKSFLQSKNFNILDVNSNLSNIDQIRNHKNNMIECDSLIVVSINANKQWLSSKMSDILKSPGIGRLRKFDHKLIYKNEDSKIDLLNNLKDITILDHKASMKENLQAIIEILK